MNNQRDLVFGRWPVREVLEAKEAYDVLIAEGVKGDPIDEILGLARENRIPVRWVERRLLDQLVGGDNHQGVLAHVPPMRVASVDQVWDRASQHKGSGP